MSQCVCDASMGRQFGAASTPASTASMSMIHSSRLSVESVRDSRRPATAEAA
jgi:hypothetical protein